MTTSHRDDLDGVGELFFDLGRVGHENDLPEAGAEPADGVNEPVAVLTVERADDLVEYEQPDLAAGQEADLLGDGDPERQVGEIGLRARVTFERMLGSPDETRSSKVSPSTSRRSNRPSVNERNSSVVCADRAGPTSPTRLLRNSLSSSARRPW